MKLNLVNKRQIYHLLLYGIPLTTPVFRPFSPPPPAPPILTLTSIQCLYIAELVMATATSFSIYSMHSMLDDHTSNEIEYSGQKFYGTSFF